MFVYGVGAQVDKLDKTVVGEEGKLRGTGPLFMFIRLGGRGSEIIFGGSGHAVGKT